jgi:Tfp pilus assembly protein PilN
LNLAERPFVNERPAIRTTILLWVMALLLVALNVTLYQRHLSGQQEQRQRIGNLEASIAEERAVILGLEENLAALDLQKQNRQVVYLNTQIASRTFSWSQLLDRLAEVLPETVQLRRLSPRIVDKGGRRLQEAQSPSAEVVAIDMGGVARSSEAALQLVDRLFEHPSFTAPNLASEWEQDRNQHEFSLSVLYLPAKTGEVESLSEDSGEAEAAELTELVGEGR